MSEQLSYVLASYLLTALCMLAFWLITERRYKNIMKELFLYYRDPRLKTTKGSVHTIKELKEDNK